METGANHIQWILGMILILSSLGMILAPKPVHASLSFLLTLMTLAILYIQLSAPFLGVMQVLIYAGAILVIFMFVMILFQDAYQNIAEYQPKSSWLFLSATSIAFMLVLLFLTRQLIHLPPFPKQIPEDYGSTASLGKALYLDFFFPFEAVGLIFLIAVIGALYIARRLE
jgi:NADH-quinone oxidoreductase subunit J